jgi:hypothetical protein
MATKTLTTSDTNRSVSSVPDDSTSHEDAALPTAERCEPTSKIDVEAAGATKINRRSSMNMMVRTAIVGTAVTTVPNRPIARTDDPIFAIIKRHRAAIAAHREAVRIEFAFEETNMKGKKLKQFQTLQQATQDACQLMDDIGAELVNTPPTTFAGIAAWARYAEPLLNETDAPDLPEEVKRSDGTSSTSAAAFANTLRSAVETMPKANDTAPSDRSNTTDAKLFKLHDAFCDAYATMKGLDGGAGAGSRKLGSKEEKAVNRRWERAVDTAVEKARAVIAAPAFTMEGMLMKLHIAGFAITGTKPGTFTMPYEIGGSQQWQPGRCANHDEAAIIVSLRADLQNFRTSGTTLR